MTAKVFAALSCSTRNLSCGMQGSNSLSKDQTWATSFGSVVLAIRPAGKSLIQDLESLVIHRMVFLNIF